MGIPIQVQDWVKKYHAESFAWAMSCCYNNQAEAADVLQNSYVKVLENKANFDHPKAFKAWLFRVIKNKAIDAFRTRYRRGQRNWRVVSDSLAFVENEALAEEENAASHQISYALAQCSEKQRQVLQLVFYHDLTLKQTAQIMGISLGSAHTHYDRGKKKLRELLTIMLDRT